MHRRGLIPVLLALVFGVPGLAIARPRARCYSPPATVRPAPAPRVYRSRWEPITPSRTAIHGEAFPVDCDVCASALSHPIFVHSNGFVEVIVSPINPVIGATEETVIYNSDEIRLESRPSGPVVPSPAFAPLPPARSIAPANPVTNPPVPPMPKPVETVTPPAPVSEKPVETAPPAPVTTTDEPVRPNPATQDPPEPTETESEEVEPPPAPSEEAKSDHPAAEEATNAVEPGLEPEITDSEVTTDEPLDPEMKEESEESAKEGTEATSEDDSIPIELDDSMTEEEASTATDEAEVEDELPTDNDVE